KFWRSSFRRTPCAQPPSLSRLPLTQQKLPHFSDTRFIVRVVLQNPAQDFFCLFVLVLHPVQPREPQCGFRVRWVEPYNFLELLRCAPYGFRLPVTTRFAKTS